MKLVSYFKKNHCLEMPCFELSQSPRLYQADKSISICLWPAGQKLPPNWSDKNGRIIEDNGDSMKCTFKSCMLT